MFCYSCNIQLTDQNWSSARKKQNVKICINCVRKSNNKSYQKNKLTRSKNNKLNYQKIKEKVFEYYGNKCQICQEENFNKLSLDHIDGNGRQHRKQILKTDSGSQFYKWVLKNKPNNLRILCFNCNCAHENIIQELIINNKDYLINKNCKYCFNENNIRNYVCNFCRKIEKKNYKTKLKQLVFKTYGGECKFCQVNNINYLTIDHIDNSGSVHRKEIGQDIYTWLKLNGFPKDNFQILCFNCNYSKAYIPTHFNFS